ncbi:MAG: hypothetical protein M1838_004796 [Thelocarpon superellum]|nr:MAG: hypothetical protein M1838_004796 [Thelocarpon superellum]
MRSPVVSSVSTPDPASAKSPTVCVFCGSSPGKSPAHLAAARALGETLHAQGLKLVYGGGPGMMAEVAQTLVSLSGPSAVHGIVPEPLMLFEQGPDRAIDEAVYGRTTVVPDMHTRKQLMAREVMDGGPGGGFVALSGGYGTMEELMEVVTWNQLGIHERGIVVFNVEGYYDGLLQWVANAVDAGFIGKSNQNIMIEAKTATEVVEALRGYVVSKGRFNLAWGKQ